MMADDRPACWQTIAYDDWQYGCGPCVLHILASPSTDAIALHTNNRTPNTAPSRHIVCM